MMKNIEDLQIITKELDIINLSVSHKVHDAWLTDLSAYIDYISDSLVIRLDAYLAAERAQEIRSDIVASVPATWFDHFRHSCFPTLLTNMFPIKYKEITHTYETIHYHVVDDVAVTPDAIKRGKIYVHTYE